MILATSSRFEYVISYCNDVGEPFESTRQVSTHCVAQRFGYHVGYASVAGSNRCRR